MKRTKRSTIKDDIFKKFYYNSKKEGSGVDFPKYKSKEELLKIAKSTSGHRIHEYNIHNRSLDKNNKGVIGQIIEEGVFHYPINSRPEADFAELGVELKVTGLKPIHNNNFTIKERLVLNVIDYMQEYNIPFDKSKFWEKNKTLLIMFYLYDSSRNDYDFLLIDSILHNFSKKDLEIVKNDWKIITEKIRDGKAHEISESDTMYLGACTKGSNRENSYRMQPNSPIKARQRAFCLKSSYMKNLVEENLLGKKCASLVTEEEIQNSTFEIAIQNRLKPFYGRTVEELYNFCKIKIPDNKSKLNYLTSHLLGFNGRNLNECEEFAKSNTILKTIRMEENGNIIESMSFPTFEFTKIVKEEFEDSDLYNDSCQKRFFFVIYKKINGKYALWKTLFYNLPFSIIDKEIRETFDETKRVLLSGNIVKSISPNGTFHTNFPKSSYNKICHVRPHDVKSVIKTGKGYPLPVADKLTGLTKYTKQCFWLDRNFILKILNS